jgi:hypothetical protein
MDLKNVLRQVRIAGDAGQLLLDIGLVDHDRSPRRSSASKLISSSSFSITV